MTTASRNGKGPYPESCEQEQEDDRMNSNHSALVAIVQARQEDEAFMSALGAAARRLLGDAEARAEAMRADARQLRRAAWRDLEDAKTHSEEAGQRLAAISALELDDGVKNAALHAARMALSLRRSALRKAAEALEATVARAQALESRADEVMGAVRKRPEVAAWEAVKGPSENGKTAPCPAGGDSRLSMAGEATEAHDR
jgi:hypothetical protein